MKEAKAPGLSGIVVEMIWAGGDTGGSMIHELAAAIIRDGKVPSDWEQSFIVCLYEGKGNALERGNYHGLRAGHESPAEDCGQPHQTVGVNWQFPVWLHPRQRHNRHNLCSQAAAREVSSCQQETLHGFCRPGEGVWPSASEGHLVGAEKTWCGEWIVRLVQGMYANARSHVHVSEGCNEEFEVKVGVPQGSVLSPLLFIISSLCLKPCHASSALGSSGLVIIAESLEKCVRKQWRRKDWE